MKRNNNIEFDTKMKELCNGVYPKKRKSLPKDWIPFDRYEDKNGFYGEAFYNKNTIAIVFRGSNDTKDWISNIEMGAKQLPWQYWTAQSFYNKINAEFPNSEIVFTGHSLGGSLAQILGNETGNETVTFNAYGTGNIININPNNLENIRNYGHGRDVVFKSNFLNHIGNIYILNNEVGKIPNDLKYHFLQNLGNLKDRKVYTNEMREQCEKETPSVLCGESSYSSFQYYDRNRILTNEEIGEMSPKEYNENENFIRQLLEFGNIMPEAAAKEKVRLGELIWVNGYTRDDGTEVKGYYRRK